VFIVNVLVPRRPRPAGGQHPGRRRAHAPPPGEGLGRLLDQHAQAVAADGAMPGRPGQEGAGGRAVHQVQCQGAGPQHRGRHGDVATAQAAGGGVEHHVEAAAGRVQAAGLQIDAVAPGQVGVPRHQGLGLVQAAVGQHQPGRSFAQQGAQHTGPGTAGPDQQHAPAGQRHAGIGHDVAHQAHAVGVVGQPALAIAFEGVDRAGQLGALAALGRGRKGLELEGHGDVAARPPRAAKSARVWAKPSSGASRRS
jgi:hypothetical protein